jgi:hypothetical protein
VHRGNQFAGLARALSGHSVEEILDIESHCLNVYFSLLQTRNVNMTGRKAVADIQIFVANAIREVIVPIPHNRIAMEAGDLFIAVAGSCSAAGKR